MVAAAPAAGRERLTGRGTILPSARSRREGRERARVPAWRRAAPVLAICWLAAAAITSAAQAADWRLDSSFGAGGVERVAGGRYWSLLAPGPQGSVYVGAGARGRSRSFLITRVSAAGKVIRSFGSDGVASVPAVASQASPQMFVLSDGGLLVAGSDSAGHFVLTRLSAAGNLDHAFGHDGVAQYTLPDILDTSPTAKVALEPDGDILAAYQDFGSGEVGPGETPGPVELLRLKPSGALDHSFGRGGFLVLGSSLPVSGDISGMTVAPDGSILLAYDEALTHPATGDAGIVELSSQGVPISAFGDGGFAPIPASSDIETPDLAGLFALPGGVVEADFLSTVSAKRSGLFRFAGPAGAPDPAFGVAGAVVVASGGSGVAVSSSGETFIVGSFDHAMLVDGVLSSGAPDPALGGSTGARFTAPLPPGANEKEIEAVLPAEDGLWVLVAGCLVRISA
jgi:uncharacterized delta-60 repeat protein